MNNDYQHVLYDFKEALQWNILHKNMFLLLPLFGNVNDCDIIDFIKESRFYSQLTALVLS